MLGMTGCMSTSDRTAGRVMDDNKVSGRVKSALNHDPVFKYEDVDVRTYNGVVQLSGWATTPDQVERASGIAQRVDGVSGVINHISIKRTPTGRSDGNPYSKLADDPNYYGRTNTLDKTNTLDNPILIRTDIQAFQERIVDNVFWMEMANSVDVQLHLHFSRE